MATYCKNHVEEEVERLSKLGKVEEIPTKEGTCGHLGGCNTGNVELVGLKCEYDIKPESKEAPAEEETPKEETGAETTTETTTETTGEGDTGEEKPVTA